MSSSLCRLSALSSAVSACSCRHFIFLFTASSEVIPAILFQLCLPAPQKPFYTAPPPLLQEVSSSHRPQPCLLTLHVGNCPCWLPYKLLGSHWLDPTQQNEV
ncbi:hypothetical protein FKM82_028320 [Ascaphus truei]